MRETHDNVNGAPAAIGPYSTAVSVGDILYTSGQLPLDPDTGNIVGDDVATQAKQSLENLKTIVEALGSNMKNVIKTTIYLTDIDSFLAFNDVYADFFHDSCPARSCVEVSNLPKGAKIEIEGIALKI